MSHHHPLEQPAAALGTASLLDGTLAGCDHHTPAALHGGAQPPALQQAADEAPSGAGADTAAVTAARQIEASLVRLGKQLRSLEGLALKVGVTGHWSTNIVAWH